MKKIILKTLIIIGMILVSTRVYGTTANVTMNGESTAKEGETKKIEIKISSSETIGVVSGKVEANSNIEISSIDNKNGWSCTYNKETGVFNTYKAEGAKEEVIFEITYKAKSEGTGNIKISEINVTNIEYNSSNISNVEKQISVTKEESRKDETNNGEQNNKKEDETNNGEQNNKTDDESKSDNEIKDVYIIEGGDNTSDTENEKITNAEETKSNTSNKKLPYTGEKRIIGLIAVIMIIAIVMYKKYTNIKSI